MILGFCSATHLDWPGVAYLQALINRLVTDVQPDLVLSIGTAGGAQPRDHIGTVRAVSAATLYKAGEPPTSWPEYRNAWQATDTTLGNANFSQLLFPVPTAASGLQSLCSQFNQHYGTNYTM